MAVTVETPHSEPPADSQSDVSAAPLHRFSGAGVGVVTTVAAALIAALWAFIFLHHQGDFEGFVYFGHDLTQAIHPPDGARITSSIGYDGQYSWRMAASPLLSDHQVLSALVGNQYRAQRILYPTLAWLLAGGQQTLIPFTLQLIGWASILGLVALMSATAVRYGRSAWWGLPLGLLPGMYLGMLRDVTDPLAVTLMVAALVALDRRRIALATAATVAAVLTRESMLLLPIALVASLAAAHANIPKRLKPVNLPALAWMPAAAAVGTFAIWEFYATARLGRAPFATTSDQQFGWPFRSLVDQLRITAHDANNSGRFPLLVIANPLYLYSICFAAAAAIWAATRRLDPAAVLAALFAVVAVTQTYGDHWSYTRATAPLFAALAYVALQRSYSRTLIVIAAGAALLPLYPA